LGWAVNAIELEYLGPLIRDVPAGIFPIQNRNRRFGREKGPTDSAPVPADFSGFPDFLDKMVCGRFTQFTVPVGTGFSRPAIIPMHSSAALSDVANATGKITRKLPAWLCWSCPAAARRPPSQRLMASTGMLNGIFS
jgi:hypothetical protein